MPEEVAVWQRVIASSGGEVETVYGPRVTHVLCETQKSATFHRVICAVSLCLAVIVSKCGMLCNTLLFTAVLLNSESSEAILLQRSGECSSDT